MNLSGVNSKRPEPPTVLQPDVPNWLIALEIVGAGVLLYFSSYQFEHSAQGQWDLASQKSEISSEAPLATAVAANSGDNFPSTSVLRGPKEFSAITN